MKTWIKNNNKINFNFIHNHRRTWICFCFYFFFLFVNLNRNLVIWLKNYSLLSINLGNCIHRESTCWVVRPVSTNFTRFWSFEGAMRSRKCSGAHMERKNISNKHSKVNGKKISHKFMDLHKIEIMKRLKNKNKILQRHSRSTFCGRFLCSFYSFFSLNDEEVGVLSISVGQSFDVFLWHWSVLSYHQRLWMNHLDIADQRWIS